LASYQHAWMRAFGLDFPISAAAGRAIRRLPFLLDTAALAAQRHGAKFMDQFGAAMTGAKPKSVFLSPRMALPLGAALMRLSLRGLPGSYNAGPRMEARSGFSFAENALTTERQPGLSRLASVQ
jgi:hypothetical protein